MLTICKKCQKRKEQILFPVCSTKKTGFKTICKTCYNAYMREYLKTHKTSHQARVRKNKSTYRNVIHNIKVQFGCYLCKYNKHHSALHFHHINPEDKCFQISSHTVNLDYLQEEIDKCCILCANCHAEVEAGLPHKLDPIVIDVKSYFNN